MINSVCLVGNLAAAPEIRATPSGKKVAKMRIAVNEYWVNRQTGSRNERTHWFSLNAWDRMADICERYLRKGVKIAVRGSLEYQEWTGTDGAKRSKIEVRVREMEILTPKGMTDRSGEGSDSSGGHQRVNDYGSYDGQQDDFPDIPDDEIPF